MPLIPWRPFRDLEKWFEEEWPEIWEWPERWLPSVPRGALMRTPRVDVYETDGDVVAEFELPGVDPKNIDVEVKDDMIKVEAKAEEKKEEKKKGYYRKELSRGYYKRIVPLPVNVQENKAEASYKQGVLKVVIPKVESRKKAEKKVKVKVKSGK
ncbi:MAG: Hsp20/alpha crystallin family protein [Candidatus Nealsonbacteria bacterium]|nr:MAG: Hsp20/alpha crystallin family protein [Candidatus Nealsonbacteria bacterium]